MVAIVSAVNSKSRKYDPYKWMMDGGEMKREEQKRRAAELRAKGPLDGDVMLRQMRAFGVPVIDLRGKQPPMRVIIN